MKQLCNTLPFIAMVLFLAVIACQHDDGMRHKQQEQSQETNLIIKMESGDHMRYLNPSVFRKLLKTSQYTKTLTVAKDGTGSGSYSLALQTIQVIERNTYTQYTTSVIGHAQQDLYLINYMLLKFDDGREYQFLVKYPRFRNAQGGGIDHANALMETIDGETLLHKYSIGGSRPCLNGVPELVDTVEQYTCETTRCTGELRHAWGEQCPCDNLSSCTMPTRTCGWSTISIWECSSTGGGNDNGNDGTAGGGGNDPNNDPDEDDPIETVPLLSARERIERCMNNSFSPLLSQDQLNWLDNIGKDARKISDYLESSGCDTDSREFILEAIEAMILEDITFEEFMTRKVNELLETNPLALLEIDCDQIQYWQTLAQHTVPQWVKNKIDNLPSSWTNSFYIQELDNAGGTAVNMDYFGVKVTVLPVKPNTNPAVRYTPDEYLDYIRRNFNSFVEESTFVPYCEFDEMCTTETALWNSNNPVGSIIYIDIPGDDGVVVCSEYTNSYWYFMTMNAPYAGNHPVSGTRQFGYETNLDGSYNFFVRGVDRFNNNAIENLSWLMNGFNAFSPADALWQSFQTKLKAHVDSNFGASTKIQPTKNRPDWEKVEKVLKGELPITKLGCNN